MIKKEGGLAAALTSLQLPGLFDGRGGGGCVLNRRRAVDTETGTAASLIELEVQLQGRRRAAVRRRARGVPDQRVAIVDGHQALSVGEVPGTHEVERALLAVPARRQADVRRRRAHVGARPEHQCRGHCAGGRVVRALDDAQHQRLDDVGSHEPVVV